MKIRALRTAALLAALLLLLSACAPEEEPAPSPSLTPGPEVSAPPAPLPSAILAQLPFTLPYDPQGTWDPYAGTSSLNLPLLGLIAEGLYQLDNTFTPQPLLALSAQESEDGLTWTLTLREGVTFSDGEPFTAKTAAAALTRAMGERSVYSSRLSGVKKITPMADGTLVFTLAAPDRLFPALLDIPILRTGADGPLGTGPYRLEGDRLTASPTWWQTTALPHPSIPLTPISGNEALIAAFSAGELSLAAADLTGDSSLGFAGAYQSWDYPTATMVFLGYRRDRGYCKNPLFCKALSLGLRRDSLVSETLGGHGTPALLPVPPSSKLNSVSLSRSLSYDPLAAGELLDGLGYAVGEDGLRYGGVEPVTLTLAVNSGSPAKTAMAQAIADQLEELGLTVEVKALSWDSYRKALEGKQFDLYLGETRLAGDMDLTALYTPDSGLCWGGYKSAAATAALDTARATGDWQSFYALWAEDPPFGVLCFKTGSVLTLWGTAARLTPTQGNLFYGFPDWQIN